MDNDLNNLESTFPHEDASTWVNSFSGKLVSEIKIFLYLFHRHLIYSYEKIQPPIVAQPYPQGSCFFNKLKSTHSEDALTQVTYSFSGQIVFEKIFKRCSLYIPK